MRTNSGFSATSRNLLWLSLLCVLLPAPSPKAQNQQPPVKAEVKVVNVIASVRDKHGQIVSSLGQDDFALDEDGLPQTITYFGKNADVPLTLGLLVDTSESQRESLDQERSASRSFLNDLLRPDKDRAFVIHFDREVELLQDMTSSHDKLDSALDLLQPPRPEFSNQGGSGGSGGGNGGGGGRNGGVSGAQLYDAIFLASDEVIKKQPGRKVLIVLSDGVDRGSKETLENAITTAQRDDTMVYSVYFAGQRPNQSPYGFGGPGFGHGGGRRRFPQQQTEEDHTDGKKTLDRISSETGGKMFEASKKETVDDIYKTITEDLRNQYTLGYTPASDLTPGYHTLHLTTKQKEMTVQARNGYYFEH